MANKDDYLTDYRRFFENFAQTVNPNDQLPVKLGSYKLVNVEVVGGIIDWTTQYLNQKHCPEPLLAPLIKIVIDETRKLCKKHPIACGFNPSDNAYEPLKLMQTVMAKTNEICLRYLDNSKLCSLPTPGPPYNAISVCALKNNRRRMEDRHVIIHDLNSLFIEQEASPSSYYAIFDGHAGHDAAAYSCAHLHQFLAESKDFVSNPEQALRDAFLKTDALFLDKCKVENFSSGTTAVCALHLHKEKTLYIAWVGDSQAVLVSPGRLVQCVQPHKPCREDEKNRIEQEGGVVIYWGIWRVNGQLAVSRAIGDFEYKPYVTAVPDIVEIALTGAEDFLILACDGLWDFLSENEAALCVYDTIASNPDDIESVSQRLVQLAKQQGSCDNISVIVVFLRETSKVAAEAHWATRNGLTMDTLDNANTTTNPFANSNNPDILAQKDSFVLNLADGGFKQNGTEKSPTSGFLGRPTNGKRSADEFDDDDDLGPETDVDAIDDVLLSPAIAAAKSLAEGIVNNNPSNIFDPFCDNKEEKATLETDSELQKQQSSEFDLIKSPREETPTPPADSVHDASGLVDNVADSGEDSDDEWNYFKGDTAQKENIPPSQTDKEVCEFTQADDLESDTMSQLNPNAAEFVPVSPKRNTASPAYALVDDSVIAQSPRRITNNDIDINVPNPVDFECEIKSRPSDVRECANGDDGEENSHKLSSQEIMENFLNGKSIEEIEFQPITTPTKTRKPDEFHFGPNATPFSTPAKLLDQSEALSTKAVFGDESTASYLEGKGFDSSFAGSDLNDLNESQTFGKEQDPMSMSFYQDKDDEADNSNPFDLNKVQVLPENIDDFLEKPVENNSLFNDTISDLPEHNPVETIDKENIHPDFNDKIEQTMEIIENEAVQLEIGEEPLVDALAQSPIPSSQSPLLPSQSPLPPSQSPLPPSQSPLHNISQSPIPPSQSPLPVSQSPIPMSQSPLPTSPSPLPHSPSPLPAQSPLPTAQSPLLGSQSPFAGAQSPVPVAESPVLCTSPAPGLQSPIPTAQFELPDSQSPLPGAQSPIPISCSPLPSAKSPLPTSQSPLPPSQSPLPPSQSPLPTSHSPLPTSQSPLPTSQSPLSTSQSPLPTSQSPLPTLQSPLPTSQSPLPTLQSPVPPSESPLPSIERAQSPLVLAQSPVPSSQTPILSPSPVPPSQSPAPSHSPLPELESPVEDVTSSVKDSPLLAASPVELTKENLLQSETTITETVSFLDNADAVAEEILLSESCPVSTPKSIVSEQMDTESVATTDVNSFLERSSVPDITSPLSPSNEAIHEEENRLLDAFTSKLETNKVEDFLQNNRDFIPSDSPREQQGTAPDQTFKCSFPIESPTQIGNVDVEIKSEIIAPEYAVQALTTPSEESKADDIVQNETVVLPEDVKENVPAELVVAAAAVTAAAGAVAAVAQKKTPIAKPKTGTAAAATKKPGTKPATSPTKTAPAKTAAKSTPTRTSTGTPTQKVNQVAAKTPTTPKQPTPAAKPLAKPRTSLSAPTKAPEKKSSLTNGEVKPSSLTAKRVPLSTASKTTTKPVPSKLSPTKTTTDSKTSAAARPATAPAKPTAALTARSTTVRQTRPTTLTAKTSTVSSTTKTTLSSVTATKSTVKSTTLTSPRTATSTAPKPRPATAPARPRPLASSKPLPKAADTEKQIKETTNKQITASSRTATTRTTGSTAGKTTTTVRKIEPKVPGTRTTVMKTTTTTVKAKTDPKKPAELIRHSTTKTKGGITTKKTKTEQNGVVTEINTMTTISSTIIEPPLVKDVSPTIENLVVFDNSQLPETNVTD